MSSLHSALFLLPLLTQSPPAPPERLHVVVLHTNDIHGQVLPRKATWLKREPVPEVGGLCRVAAYIASVRKECANSGEGLLVVDAGDWYQGTPEGMVDDGLVLVKALDAVGYDACAIGNHEFDRGIESLKRLLHDSHLPAVCANLEVRSTSKPVDWVEPERVVTVRGHASGVDWTLRVGCVGLITTSTAEITNPEARSLVFEDPGQALARAEHELEGKVDWVLPLTHLGVDADRKLARAHPELALIVGGHSHTFLKDGVLEDKTLIVQTGSKASAVGRVDIWFDAKTHLCLEEHARLVELEEQPAEADRNPEVEKLCAELVKRADEPMRAVIGELDEPLVRSNDPLVSGSAGNFIADALRAHTGAQVGLMNRGGIRSDVVAGPVTRRAIFELCPFDNRVSVLDLPGNALAELARRSVEDHAHSGLEVSGMTIEATLDSSGKRRFVGASVGGKPIEASASYHVAMNSFMADGGDAYIDKDAHFERRDEALFIREVLEQFVADKKRVAPAKDNRYVVRKP